MNKQKKAEEKNQNDVPPSTASIDDARAGSQRKQRSSDETRMPSKGFTGDARLRRPSSARSRSTSSTRSTQGAEGRGSLWQPEQ